MLVKGAPGGRVTDICRVNWLSLDQIMACRLFRAKPLSEPMQTYYQSDLKKFSLMKFYLKFKSFHSRKCIWKCCLQNGGHFVSASMCFKCWSITDTGPGGHFKNTYELLHLRALKFSPANGIHIFQCMGKIFCVEFQRVPLKFHTK